ncbi:hypothetical protein BAUCODRAFT_130468 [Baudoinia panamericana UAMH 10762]|uniref:Aminoglycoside phosphotransferase domain-containing protein n=1 Tax=Baudoinia panamericana (strain UAMH 10762) TaxID=717646 RepID=M2N023_BAUPA|nr:uncharacterized protein BAUCODRAFT_130468 [Baudoinia panamericana UAMH 10762]EMC97263.1 hypothetical protein BAUCODRAFT_130468 [Baudoinia panamericana UAMH 10762]
MDCLSSTYRLEQYSDARIQQVVNVCCDPSRTCLSSNGNSKVVRAGNIAIKFGRVTNEEVAGQLHARELLDPAIVRVPQIYSYFSFNGEDYVVMEFVDGAKQETIEDDETVVKVGRIVSHLHTFTRYAPGPVNMGRCMGPLWSEDERMSFTSTQSLETYVNSRLVRQTGMFSISDTPMVFTHGDIAPRNLLFAVSGIWLLDWEFAGYFPRSAEIATFRLDAGKRASDVPFYDRLEATILQRNPLTLAESAQVACWQELALNHLRFYFPTDQEKAAVKKRRRKLNGILAQP